MDGELCATDLLGRLTDKAQQTRERAVDGLSVEQRHDLLRALARVRANLGMTSPARAAGGER